MKQITILDSDQIKRKIERIAYQIAEDNFDEEEIILLSIQAKGEILSKRIQKVIQKINNLKTVIINTNIILADTNTTLINKEPFINKSVIIVDDILNTGRTMMNAVSLFNKIKLKKLRTAILINRSHKLFPINIDFSGLEVSTTLKEYIYVKLKEIDDLDAAILK